MKSLGTLFTGFAVLGMLIPVGVVRASTYQEMKQGADSYNKGKYHDSLVHFQQAKAESPDDPKVWFNLASTQYQTGRYDEAARGFEAVALQSNDPKLKQKALYNLGNTAFRRGNLQASADIYRRALDLNPSDLDAKQNLEFVLKKLEEKKQDQKQGRQQSGKRDKNRNQQQDKAQGQAVSKKEAERQGDEKSFSSQSLQYRARNNGQEAAQAGQTAKQSALPPEEAERLLNFVSDDQRAFLQEQAKRFAPTIRGREKDW